VNAGNSISQPLKSLVNVDTVIPNSFAFYTAGTRQLYKNQPKAAD
jgi:hypothetical protein